jgi:predicted Zn-dependent protease
VRYGSVVFTVLMCTGCQSMPSPCRTAVSPDAAALAGDRAAPAIEACYGGLIRNGEAERRMARIGRRLVDSTAELDGAYAFRLLDTDGCNAVSLPGARIYITRGLFERLDSDKVIAAVLAHEMAHLVTGDHFKKRCTCVAEALDRETAADIRGLSYLQHAGIDGQAMVDVLKLIADVQPMGWSDSRIRALAPYIQGDSAAPRAVRNLHFTTPKGSRQR